MMSPYCIHMITGNWFHLSFFLPVIFCSKITSLSLDSLSDFSNSANCNIFVTNIHNVYNKKKST